MARPEERALLARFGSPKRVGEGGFAHVYRVERKPQGGPAALKILLRASSDPAVRRFRREAEAMRNLSSPHLVKVYEFDLEHDPPYLLLEWMGGGTLSGQLPKHTPAPPARARKVARELLAGIDTLHRAGLVHRDVKPQNILLREDGSAALADLGLVGSEEASTLTDTGAVLGTPRYMPPEVLLGKRWTPQGDLFGLGVALWEFAVGQHPAAHYGWALTAFLDADLELPRIHGSGGYQNPGLQKLLDRLCHPSPEQRPRSAAEALALLGDEATLARADAAAVARHVPGGYAPEPGSDEDAVTHVAASGPTHERSGEAKATRTAEEVAPVAPAQAPGPAARAGARAQAGRPLAASGPGSLGRPPAASAPGAAAGSRARQGMAAGVALCVVALGMLRWARPGSGTDPGGPGTDPAPEGAPAAFPEDFVPGTPRLRYLEGGRLQLGWRTPAQAFARGSVRNPGGIQEIPRGRSEQNPVLVLPAPPQGQPWQEAAFELVDREGRAVPAPIPPGLVLASMADALEGLMTRLAQPGDDAEALARFEPLAEAFAQGWLGKATTGRLEMGLYHALDRLEAGSPEVRRACRLRLGQETLTAAPSGSGVPLELPEGQLPPGLEGSGPVTLALETGSDRSGPPLRLGFRGGATVRIPVEHSEWVVVKVPGDWLPPGRHKEYRLEADEGLMPRRFLLVR